MNRKSKGCAGWSKPKPIEKGRSYSLMAEAITWLVLSDNKSRRRHLKHFSMFRAEFQRGGLVRSAGGDNRSLLGRKIGERDPPDSPEAPDGGRGKGDERILGSGDFVTETLRKAGKDWEKCSENKMLLAELIQKVAPTSPFSFNQY